jgi:hypothetical protein
MKKHLHNSLKRLILTASLVMVFCSTLPVSAQRGDDDTSIVYGVTKEFIISALNNHHVSLGDSSGRTLGQDILVKADNNAASAILGDIEIFTIKMETWGPHETDPAYPTFCFTENGRKQFELNDDIPCFAVRYHLMSEPFSDTSKYANVEIYDPMSNIVYFTFSQVYTGE